MENKNELPLRIGVGIVLLNYENKVFVGKRIDNQTNSHFLCFLFQLQSVLKPIP